MANPAAARSSATNWLLMLAALVVIVVFMVWLRLTAEPSVVTVVKEDATEPATMGGPVTAEELGADPARYHEQVIEVGGVTVVRYAGPQVLWIDLPTGPFLVKLSEALAATAPGAGSAVNLAGTVLPKTDSVLNAWQQAGAIPDAAERTAMEAGTSFLEAVRITPAGGQ